MLNDNLQIGHMGVGDGTGAGRSTVFRGAERHHGVSAIFPFYTYKFIKSLLNLKHRNNSVFSGANTYLLSKIVKKTAHSALHTCNILLRES